MARVIPIAVVSLIIAAPVHAQDVTSEIDEIFSWATSETPGCALAVARDGTRVVSRAYGQADLERGVPITPGTVFDIGSVQKQFVAAAILLLAEDGRIGLTDDIRGYFPELPDYGHTITVDHLLTHTSGVRDWVQLGNLSSEDEEALTMILRQRGLDFVPGEEWMYSNSGYVLLKELVARVTGMTFAEFARQRLFEPLDMKSTVYATDIRAAGEKGARAYEREGDGWKEDVMLGEARGGGAVLSTAEDLLIWNEALTEARLGAFVSAKIQEPARLRTGRELSYARGLFVEEEEEGTRVVWHTGGARAFSAMLARLPDHGLSVSVLCNAGDFGSETGSMRRVMNLFAPPPESPDAAATGAAGSSETAAPATPDLSGKAGLYFSEGTGESLRLVAQDDRLRVDGGPALVAVTEDRFRVGEPTLRFRSGDAFELRFLSPDHVVLTSMEGEAIRYRRARSYAPTAEELEAFVGRYESDELRSALEVSTGPDGLTIRLNDSRPFPFRPVEPDAFGLGRMLARFHRDGTGRVVGLEYRNPVLHGVRYTRVRDTAGGPPAGGDAAPPEAEGPASAGVDVAPEALVGFYEGAQPGRGITISLEDGTLHGQPTGQPKVPLVPGSGTTYFVGREGSPATVTFTLDAEGGVAALVLRTGSGGERTFPRAR